ncbi:MAG: U32 family peptidase [Candidatus Melainabacteria bacterium]
MTPPPAKPELLLPAGSPEKRRVAIAYGADAIYMGLPMASLRTPSRGEQFTPANLPPEIADTQAQGVKAYITLNIFAANHDLKRLIPHLEAMEAARPDAFIISDPGIFRLARKHAPGVPIHISTQANTLNREAAAFWQDLGATRVILAREMPLREIAETHAALPDLELETFVHGSLCVAYSGRCVISDYLTDNTKNSNKGMCGNSCRWEFEQAEGHGLQSGAQPSQALPGMAMNEVTRPGETYTFEEDQHGSYMLNSRDLCLVAHLKTLAEAGVCSFKVEGRTKSLYYVATAGQVYREAIDAFAAGDASDDRIRAWTARLARAGNRGFTEGFLNGRPDHTAINYQTSKTRQESVFLATALEYDARTQRVQIQARNPVTAGDTVTAMLPGPAATHSATFALDKIQDDHGLPLSDLQTNQTGWIALPETLRPQLSEHWSYLMLSADAMPAQPPSVSSAPKAMPLAV